MPVGIAAGGQCFAGSCLSVADADGALPAHSVGEFNESAVLFRGDESLRGHQSSSRYVRSLGFFRAASSDGDGVTAGGVGWDEVTTVMRSLIWPRSWRRRAERAAWMSLRLTVAEAWSGLTALQMCWPL